MSRSSSSRGAARHRFSNNRSSLGILLLVPVLAYMVATAGPLIADPLMPASMAIKASTLYVTLGRSGRPRLQGSGGVAVESAVDIQRIQDWEQCT